MTNNIYRGAKVSKNDQQNQGVAKPVNGYVYRGIKHQGQQQSDVQQTSGIYRGTKWFGGTEKNGQMR